MRSDKGQRPLEAGVGENLQALSSRIPPIRAVAISGNLYKSHACLRSKLYAITPNTPRKIYLYQPIKLFYWLLISTQRLVKDGLLVSDGVGRGMVYFLPWQERRGVTMFESEGAPLLPPELSSITPDLSALPLELSSLTPELLNFPPDPGAQVVSDLSQLSEAEIAMLRQRAAPVSERLRANPDLVRQTVLALCDGRYLGLRVLADLLKRRDRDGKDLRTRILNPLVAEGALLRAYPKANDPRQAYITSPSTGKE